MFSRAIWNKQALVNFSKTPNCTRSTGSCNFVSLLKHLITLAYLFQIALEIM